MIRVFALLILFLALPIRASETLRCGTRLVTMESSQTQILAACGEPAQKRVGVQRNYLRNKKGYITGEIQTETEVWIYERGPNQFRALLSFEGGKLKSMDFERP